MKTIYKHEKELLEHMNCGREQDGKNAAATGVCPAATDMRLNGIHAGETPGGPAG